MRAFLGPRENSFIHSVSHSFPKVLSSGVWPLYEPVTICLNNLKTALVRTEAILSAPKQLKAWPIAELAQVLHFHTCTTWSFPNVAQPSCFQKQLHFSHPRNTMVPLVWGNMLQCFTLSFKCKHSQKSFVEYKAFLHFAKRTMGSLWGIASL